MTTASSPSLGFQTPPDSATSSRRSSTASSRFTRIERRLSNGVVSTSCILTSDLSSSRRNSARPSFLKTGSLPVSKAELNEHHEQREVCSLMSPERREILDEMRPQLPKTGTLSKPSLCHSFDDADMVMKLETSLRSKSSEVAQLRQIIQELQMAVWSRSRDAQLEERTRIAEKRAASLSNTVDILNCKLNDAEAWSEQVKREYQRQFQILENQIAELKAAQDNPKHADSLSSSNSNAPGPAAFGSTDQEVNGFHRSFLRHINLLLNTESSVSSALAEVIAERDALIGALKVSGGMLQALEKEYNHLANIILNSRMNAEATSTFAIALCNLSSISSMFPGPQPAAPTVSKFSQTENHVNEKLQNNFNPSGIPEVLSQSSQPQRISIFTQTDLILNNEAASQAGHPIELNLSSVQILTTVSPVSVSEASQQTFDTEACEVSSEASLLIAAKHLHEVDPSVANSKDQHVFCDAGSQTEFIECLDDSTVSVCHRLLSQDERSEADPLCISTEPMLRDEALDVKKRKESFSFCFLDQPQRDGDSNAMFDALPNDFSENEDAACQIAPLEIRSSSVLTVSPQTVESPEEKSDSDIIANTEPESRQSMNIKAQRKRISRHHPSSFSNQVRGGSEASMVQNANERIHRTNSTKTYSKPLHHQRAPSTPQTISPSKMKSSHGALVNQASMRSPNHNRTRSLNRLFAIEDELKQLQRQNSSLKKQINLNSDPPVFTMSPIEPLSASDWRQKNESELLAADSLASSTDGNLCVSTPITSAPASLMPKNAPNECTFLMDSPPCYPDKNVEVANLTDYQNLPDDSSLKDYIAPFSKDLALTEIAAPDAPSLINSCAKPLTPNTFDQNGNSSDHLEPTFRPEIFEKETPSLLTPVHMNVSSEKLLPVYVSEPCTINDIQPRTTFPLQQFDLLPLEKRTNLKESNFFLKTDDKSAVDNDTAELSLGKHSFSTPSDLITSSPSDLFPSDPVSVAEIENQAIALQLNRSPSQVISALRRRFSDSFPHDRIQRKLFTRRRKSLDLAVNRGAIIELPHTSELLSTQAIFNDAPLSQMIPSVKLIAKHEDGVPKWRKLVRRRIDFILYAILALCLHIGIELSCIYSQYC